MMDAVYPWGKGTPRWVRDATANDSDKSFTVPAGKIWVLALLYAELFATAVVGNRNMIWSLSNGANIIQCGTTGPNCAANQTVNALYMPGIAGYSTTVGVRLTTLAEPTNKLTSFAPPLLMREGYILRVYDVNAIDAAADDLTVVLHYVEYDA